MNFTHVKIATTVPAAHADAMRQAIGEAGAGRIGEYSFCSFSVTGQGRFLPSSQDHPHIGQPSQFETVTEERIEVVCEVTLAKQVLAALRAAHPYEEVIIDIVPLLDENQLP